MSFNSSIGLEIRENSVIMVWLKAAYTRVKLGAHSVCSLEEYRSLAEKLDAVSTLLSDFKTSNRIGNCPVFLGIPRNLILSREICFPLAVKENLRTTLSYEMEKHVPVPAGELFFDCQIIEENKSLNRMTVLLAAAKKTSLSLYLALCRKLSGKISGMEGTDSAMANFHAFVSEGKTEVLAEPEILRRAGIPSPELIPAFGLALKGLRSVPLQINLLPDELRKKPGKLGFYMMSGLAVLLLLAALGWGGSYLWRQHKAVKALNEEMRILTKEVAEIEDMQTRIREMESRVNRIRELKQGYIPVVDIIRELTGIIPETAWVQDFSFSDQGIQINGFADSTSDLIGILEASPLFENVSFLSAIVKGREGKERFSIGLKTEKGGAQVSE